MAPAGVELAVEGGITYELKLSAKPSDNNGGYEGVVKAGNLFHAKPTLERGGGQTMLPGTGENAPAKAAGQLVKLPYGLRSIRPRLTRW